MITFRTSAEITSDHQVVLALPPEVPVGMAELTVTVTPHNGADASRSTLRQLFGTVRGGNERAADNEQIDVDLSRSYGDSHD